MGVRIAAALAVGALLAGCGSPVDEPEETTAAADTAFGAEPDGGYDVGRLSDAADIFPEGYDVKSMPVAVLTREEADQIAGMYDSIQISFDPPHCRSLSTPFRLTEGSATGGSRSVKPATIVVMASRLSVPNPDPVVDASCAKVTMDAPGVMTGVATAIDAPQIPDVTTLAVKSVVDGQQSGMAAQRESYTMVAVLSDRTSVMVQGEKDPKLLGDMLVKAVEKLRA
ncbi:DUF5642 family protein [Mycolicibacterium brumae]|nr:DUF5642 family protein [Mycolicibacterium brumae]MCV7194434.1 DUF5642 family protein [Mycolicibacterium brumae]UWW10529.1 DUF5642 family protein [Mycolicibacterium brumae]